MWFIGVKVEQETSAPPPKKNPGSAPATDPVSGNAFDAKRKKKGDGLNDKRWGPQTTCNTMYLVIYDIDMIRKGSTHIYCPLLHQVSLKTGEKG